MRLVWKGDHLPISVSSVANNLDKEAEHQNTFPSNQDIKQDDPMTPITEMEEIIKALPHGLGTFEKIPNCGHGPYRDAPAHMVRLLREFLNTHVAEAAQAHV